MKKEGAGPRGIASNRKKIVLLSSGEIDNIYQTYLDIYRKSLRHYDYSHEGRKTVAYHLYI
jgi:hypothetical protein